MFANALLCLRQQRVVAEPCDELSSSAAKLRVDLAPLEPTVCRLSRAAHLVGKGTEHPCEVKLERWRTPQAIVRVT